MDNWMHLSKWMNESNKQKPHIFGEREIRGAQPVAALVSLLELEVSADLLLFSDNSVLQLQEEQVS